MTNPFVSLVETREIVVCCGTGGVGKTTTAAVLAIEAARRGRRAVVVTIDPAKRLADTLGLSALSNEPALIDQQIWDVSNSAQRSTTGSLSALMLDTKSTFDKLVLEHAPDAEAAERILDNRFYRNVSGALGGTQEYMAMEKLYELHTSRGFDLIVIDTPPSRHALDFLEAPERLLRMLDNRMFRLLMMPTKTYMKLASVALQALLRTVSRVVGREVVEDAIAFFQAFEGMEQGFRERAAKVQALIDDPATAFVLVTAPRRDAVDEAMFFSHRLETNGLAIAGLIVNRIHPTFGDAAPDALRAAAQGNAAILNLADYRDIAIRERATLEGLTTKLPSDVVGYVPLLDCDVHDIAGLALVASSLF